MSFFCCWSKSTVLVEEKGESNLQRPQKNQESNQSPSNILNNSFGIDLAANNLQRIESFGALPEFGAQKDPSVANNTIGKPSEVSSPVFGRAAGASQGSFNNFGGPNISKESHSGVFKDSIMIKGGNLEENKAELDSRSMSGKKISLNEFSGNSPENDIIKINRIQRREESSGLSGVSVVRNGSTRHATSRSDLNSTPVLLSRRTIGKKE